MKSFFAAILIFSSIFFAGPSMAEQMPPEVQNGLNELRDFRSDDSGHAILNFLMNGGQQSYLDASLLSTISGAINLIALTMMAVLTGVGGATYVIQTANKGTPGGQVISSFWMPIRITAATILLIPLTSGYSTIQIGVFNVAEAGNNSGNYLLSRGLDYVYENGIYRPPAITDLAPMISGWVTSEVCAQYTNLDANEQRIQRAFRQEESSASVRTIFSYDEIGTKWNSGDTNPQLAYCGGVSMAIPREARVPDAKAYDYATPARIQQKFQTLVIALQPKIEAIAQKILSDQDELYALQNGGGIAEQDAFESATAQVPSEMQKAAGEYAEIVNYANAEIVKIIATSVNEQAADNAGKDWKNDIKAAGWPALGTLFWQMQRSQQHINYLAKIFAINAHPPQPTVKTDQDERYKTIYGRLDGLKKFALSKPRNYDLDNGILVSVSMAGTDGSGDAIKGFFAAIGQTFVKSLVLGGADADLITAMQYSGSIISVTSESLILLAMNADAVATGLAKTTEFISTGLNHAASNVPLVGSLFGTGATIGAAAPVGATAIAAKLMSNLLSMLQAVLIPMAIAGFVLAVILPTIPLFFWLMGVISWMLFFIECLLVSPFWLAAHGTAEKEGWGTEHTRQGYMLMIGLFLNPVLRVAGFFACLIALRPLGVLVQWLSDYLQGVLITGGLSPLMIVGSAFILAIFSYMACVRVFSLPNELFERGLRWVNGGQEVTGDEKSEHNTRMAVGAFSSKAEGAGSSAIASATKGAGKVPIPSIKAGGSIS